MVFLGDLGRDLPGSERGYWRTFNISPVGHMSETVFRRSFLGEPANPKAPDLQFKSLYSRFCVRWKESRGWELFKPVHAADQHVLMRLRVPLNESQPEFEDQILGITKLLVDSLNERQLVKELGGSEEGEKGVSKLERWLTKQRYPEVERDVAFLRRLQRLRSQISAHRKGSNYEEMLEKEGVDQRLSREVVLQLVAACQMLEGLAAHLKIDL